MTEYYQTAEGEGAGVGRGPDEDSMENVLDLLKLTNPPDVSEGLLDETEILTQLSAEITEELARDVRNLLVYRGFKDAGMFEAEDVKRLGFDICANPQALEKLIDNAKNAVSGTEPGVLDLIRARDEADFKMIQRDLTHTAYGLLRWLEIIDEEELYQLRYNGTPDDQRNLQKFARLIVAPAMTNLLNAMQTTVERGGRKFKFQEAMALAWNRARALDREQAAFDEGDCDAIERRRRLLDSPQMDEARQEFYIRREQELDTLSEEIPPPDEI
jgi:hypothetical protein